MRIHATCDSCDHEFTVGSNSAGKRVRCPECGEQVRVPADDGDTPVVRRSGSSKSRGKKRNQNQNGLLIGVGAGVGAVAIIGIVAYVVSSSGSAPIDAPPPSMPPASVAVNQPAPTYVAPAATTPVNSAPPSNSASTTPTSAHNAPSTVSTSKASDSSASTQASAGDSKTKPKDDRVKYDMVELIAKVEPSVVRITAAGPRGSGTGSGFVVDSDGTVVTNVHVIAGARKAEVEFPNGTTAPIVGFRYLDQKKDIAIVKIDFPAEKLTPVPLATALPPKGLAVVAFGAPLGLSFTSSEGIVSALRPAEEMREQFGSDFQGDWIQTSTPISPGNSGGPLVNHYGEVVAMNTMQVTTGQNLNFAMSAVDIADALSKAPAEVKPISPETVKSLPSSRSRQMASDETETERGRRLFAEIPEIFVLNATTGKMVAMDSTGLIWKKVIAKSKAAVEKSKIELSFGEPSDEAAIMFVILELKTSKKKTVTAGTQELVITAELICKDEFAKKGESKVCRVWKDDEVLGTIAANALRQGTYPKTVEENLSKFFNKFRSAAIKARASQTDDDKSDKDKSDKAKSDKDKSPFKEK